jgi:hypothetical protein
VNRRLSPLRRCLNPFPAPVGTTLLRNIVPLAPELHSATRRLARMTPRIKADQYETVALNCWSKWEAKATTLLIATASLSWCAAGSPGLVSAYRNW